MNENQEFWYFLLEGTLDDETGVFGTFYSYGTRLGNCLFKSIEIAEKEGILSPKLIETCRMDGEDDSFELPEECVRVNSEVFMFPTFHTYNLNEEKTEFVPPTGIAFGCKDGKYDTDLIKEYFVAYGKNDDGIFELELVVDNYRLIETFLILIDFMPSITEFGINILEHWDSTKTEFWTNKKLTNKKQIRAFLIENTESTLKNGFVDIIIRSKKSEINLILTEHKTIRLQTEELSFFDDFIEQIEKLGFEFTKHFHSIEFGFYHWHYRTEKSLNKEEFKKMLKNEKFKLKE